MDLNQILAAIAGMSNSQANAGMSNMMDNAMPLQQPGPGQQNLETYQNTTLPTDQVDLQDPAVLQLLASMAQPAPNVDPGTNSGIGVGAPLTAEEQAFVNAAPTLQQLIDGWGIPQKLMMEEDAKFRDIPRTGKADTRGGVARVNQYTAEHGVMASMDEKGRVTLTNIDPTTGRPTPQSQPKTFGFNPMSATMSTSINSLMDSLRTAKTPEEARSIAASLSGAVATETANLQQAALQDAERQLGIPQMMQRLKAAEAMDQATPGWQPGMGDSKNTATIRSSIFAMQDQARQVADDNLKRNLTYKQLQASTSAAELELNAAQRRFEREDARAQRKEDWQLQQEWRADAEAEEFYSGLSTEQRTIAMRLMAGSGEDTSDPLKVSRFIRQQMKMNPKFAAVLQTDPWEIPKLAISGNDVARNLVVTDEAAITGQDPTMIATRIREAQQRASSDEAITEWARGFVVPGVSPTDTIRQKKGELQALKMGNQEQQKEYRRLQGEIALSVLKKQRNADFATNVTSWGVTNPDIQKAIETTRANTGKADMKSVLRNYVGNDTGPAALAKYNAFKDELIRAASKYSQSPFGNIATSQFLAEIDDEALSNRTIWEWYKSRMGISTEGITPATVVGAMKGISPAFNMMWERNTGGQ